MSRTTLRKIYKHLGVSKKKPKVKRYPEVVKQAELDPQRKIFATRLKTLLDEQADIIYFDESQFQSWTAPMSAWSPPNQTLDHV